MHVSALTHTGSRLFCINPAPIWFDHPKIWSCPLKVDLRKTSLKTKHFFNHLNIFYE